MAVGSGLMAATLLAGCSQSASIAAETTSTGTPRLIENAKPAGAPSVSVVVPSLPAAPAATHKTTGSGLYVLDTGGVSGTVQFPAPTSNANVKQFKTLLARARLSSVYLVAVTVDNTTTKAVNLRDFRFSGEPSNLHFSPAADYVSLAVAATGTGGQLSVINEGSVASLTSPTSIPAHTKVTTLVALGSKPTTVSSVSYVTGSTTETLKPIWLIKHEQQQAARLAAAEAARLARKQERLAIQEARKAERLAAANRRHNQQAARHR